MVQGFLIPLLEKNFFFTLFEENSFLLDEVSEPSLYLNAASEVGLAVRLFNSTFFQKNIDKKVYKHGV